MKTQLGDYNKARECGEGWTNWLRPNSESGIDDVTGIVDFCLTNAPLFGRACESYSRDAVLEVQCCPFENFFVLRP